MELQPIESLCQSRILARAEAYVGPKLEQFVPGGLLRGPMLDQLLKQSPVEGCTLEQFLKDCIPWEEPHVGAGDEHQEEGEAEERIMNRLQPPSPILLLFLEKSNSIEELRMKSRL